MLFISQAAKQLRARLSTFSIYLLTGFVILFFAGAIGLVTYFLTANPTVYVTVDISTPEIAPISDDVQAVPPLNIKFDEPVAPLENINKEIAEGVQLQPEVKGAWHWQDDDHLIFEPNEPWIAAQTYAVTFDRKLFTPETKLQTYTHKFTTTPFAATIDKLEFYQDPIKPTEQKIVATVTFNYPVDTDSFAKNVSFIYQQMKNDKLDLNAPQIPLTVKFGKLNRQAYIQSDVLKLGKEPQYVNLIINKDAKAAVGKSTLAESVTGKILLPDSENILKVNNVSTTIVNNLQGYPEQILNVRFSIGVASDDLNKVINAYLLPADFKSTSPDAVTDKVMEAATRVALQPTPSAYPYETSHSFRYTAPSGRYLFITIDERLPGYGGYHLSKKYQAIVQAPNYPKNISFLHSGSIMALSSQHKLSVLVSGIPAVKFQISRVLSKEINHLISQTYGNFNNPNFEYYAFNETDLSELFSEVRQFNPNDPANIQYTSLDLDKYLAPSKANPTPLGLFLLKAQSWNSTDNYSTGTEVRRLILITDMGLIVKNNDDGSHDVFVQSITQGGPVANAEVNILGRNGLPIASATTDTQGHAFFSSVEQFKADKEPTVYVARKNNDISFIPFQARDRGLNLSRFDTGGISDNNRINNLTAYLFSDRGIYRPGDTIHFGMIVKKNYAEPAEVGIPVEAIITDPRGIKVLDKKLAVNEDGFLTLDYTPSETSITGDYTLTLDIIKDNKPADNLGSTQVKVADFLPDTMKINSMLTAQTTAGWVSPDGLGAKVTLQNLFGTPATNRKVTGRLLLSPQQLRFDQFAGYIFYDPSYNPAKPPQAVVDELPDQQTDDQGVAQFNFDLQRFSKVSYQLTFYTQGFEANGGRSVSAQNSVLVSPLEYLVGYKPDGDINFIKQNSQRSITLLAINKQLQQIAVANLTLQLVQQNKIATLVGKDDGTYQYETVTQETPVSTTKIDLTDAGYNYQLPASNIGSYILSVVDSNGTTLNRVAFTVTGNGQINNLQKNSELSLKLNKPEYVAGEEISLQITTPYLGSGLITIERDKVYTYKWFKMDSTSSVQSIRIPQNFVGNGYVNVTFIRDWNSPEIFLNPLSYSVAPFSVNRSKHAIKINLDAPAIAKPGETFSIQYSTNKPGKIIVYAVDEGILQAGNYTTPNPLNYFFQKRALQVSTMQTVDQILPKFIANRELSAIGGDMGEKARLNYLNPFKRKTNKPVTFWSGIINADLEPKILNYDVPDYFNGELRIMAVAVNNNSVGAAEKSALIRGDFILIPNVPTTVAPGDKFDVSVSITNNLKNSGQLPIDISLKTSPGLTVTSKETASVTVGGQQEQTANFTLTATEQLGNATLTFTANAANKSVNILSTTSVRPATPYQVNLINGDSRAATNVLPISRQLYPELRQQTVAAAAGPSIFMQGLQSYLDTFPYFCTEQISSKGFGYLSLADISDKTETAKKLDNIIQSLIERRTNEGGFTYWPGLDDTNAANNFSSVYALHFFTEARDKGFAIPPDLLNTGLDYLRNMIAEPTKDLDEARLHAYAIYLLTRNEVVTTNYLDNLQLYLNENFADTWHKDIISSFIAATYKMLQDNKTADKLINDYQLTNDSANADTLIDTDYGFITEAGANSIYIYLVAKHFPEKFKSLGDKPLISLATDIASNTIDTTTAAYTMLALGAYPLTDATNKLSIQIKQIFADKTSSDLTSSNNFNTPVPFSQAATQLQFINPDKSHYFYQVYIAGFDRNLPIKPVSQGIEIFREYTDSDNKKINGSIKLGIEITVHLKLRSVNKQNYNYIAIVDLFPGGFELVPNSFSGTYSYFDAREDRVIFFTGADPNVKEITYKIKPVVKGKFTVPPAFAENMYNQRIMARGIAEKLSVD